jgi:hypothetical protein
MYRASIPSTQGLTPGASGVRAIKLGTPGGGLVRLQANGLQNGVSINFATDPDRLNNPAPILRGFSGFVPESFNVSENQGFVQFAWVGEIWAISYDSTRPTLDVTIDARN